MSIEVSVQASKMVDIESMVSSCSLILCDLLNVKEVFSLNVKDYYCQVDKQFGLIGDDISISWDHRGEINMHCHEIINQDYKAKKSTVLSAAPLRTGCSVILLGAVSIVYGRLVNELIEDGEILFKIGAPTIPDRLFERLRNHESQIDIQSACDNVLKRIGIEFQGTDRAS